MHETETTHSLPRLARIRRSFDARHIDDIEAAVRGELEAANPVIRPGASIAITAGSRGISHMARILKETASFVKRRGGAPFIVPAMGSHGGATAEGQRELLAGYGVTEQVVGAPIRSSMEVVELPRGDLGHPVYMDALAWRSDGVILVNRVKPHTDFHGFPESGLMKMSVIGLGKRAQALAIHAYGIRGLKEMIGPTARQILATGKIVLGVGIVENAYDQPALVRALRPDALEAGERELLVLAAKNMPSLPVDDLDILVVDEMGKDVSGVGMDSNIIGRFRVLGQEEPDRPRIKNVVVTDLTDASHGNAIGVGLADIVTEKLRAKIDWQSLYENLITATFLERGKLPLVVQTDRRALEVAVRCSCLATGAEPRVIRIRNTLRLEELYVSAPVLREVRQREAVEQLGDFEDPVNASGALVPFGG